jgi:hypothetical protein
MMKRQLELKNEVLPHSGNPRLFHRNDDAMTVGPEFGVLRSPIMQ